LKFEIYQSFGIQCYLIFDPVDKSLKAYKIQTGKYVQFENIEEFEVGECKLSLDVGDLW